jgi:hypothetical protein
MSGKPLIWLGRSRADAQAMKSQKTAARDIRLAKTRYEELVVARRELDRG